MAEVVTPDNLGPEFDQGNIQTDKIRLKIGAGLAVQLDGTIVRDNSGQQTIPSYGSGTFDTTTPVRLLGVDASGNIVEFNYSAPPDPTDPVYYKAAGSVLSDGTLEQGAGATVVRAGVGQYDITFNSTANTATYPVLATMQGLAQNDDYQWAYLNRTVNGFRIEVREQDNGTAAGILRDSGFSFYVPIL